MRLFANRCAEQYTMASSYTNSRQKITITVTLTQKKIVFWFIFSSTLSQSVSKRNVLNCPQSIFSLSVANSLKAGWERARRETNNRPFRPEIEQALVRRSSQHAASILQCRICDPWKWLEAESNGLANHYQSLCTNKHPKNLKPV